MALFTMTNTQMRFVQLSWTNTDGSVATPTADQLTFDSTDETVARWGMRKADGSPGDAADPGAMAVVAQPGASGNCTVHVKATNPSTTVVTLTADFTVAAAPPTNEIAGGSIDFAAAIEQVNPTTVRRR